MRSLGICSGSSTVTLVEIEKSAIDIKVKDIKLIPHDGNPKGVIKGLLEEIDHRKFDSIAITGRGFKEFVDLTKIPEALAIESAFKYVNSKGVPCNAIISLGGENFIVYKLDSSGRIINIYTGNKCASGTGEFFIQQIRRMNLSIDEAIDYARNEEPYSVSGRCSVFCKSDCTHATNKGIPKGNVIAGLCKMMAKKVLELIKDIPKENIMVVGGVTRNEVMIEYLRNEINNLIVPEEATYFEALGAALWATDNETKTFSRIDQLFTTNVSRFNFHPPLHEFEDMVTFKQMDRDTPKDGDRCILGLDVGSTTTKAVLLRESDLSITASEYLRTNGDPVRASRECYISILNQIDGKNITIRGLGVTGSGRKIAGLHALTDGVINEIIAHSTAALHFDSEVDTIFEIGGQDSKYTFIVNGVPCDYAMNEACSAGTGSFLEESAKETLGIEMERIAALAMKGNQPPNFSDQCAAFISSDIKNAFNEGISKEDIAAGLVYSICMNYLNRVKGSRPVGNKIFMQGGVCYNRAVPIAMAALSGKRIVVPPEPGLMGAYGVALEVKERIDKGLMSEKIFNLKALANRDIKYRKPFICKGGKERCDLKCSINRIVIEGKVYPFGGACNRYYNIHHGIKIEPDNYDFVALRQNLVYSKFAPYLIDLPDNAPTIGISRSFLTNTYFPLFAHFFKGIGFRPILAESVDEEGIDRCSAPLCFPCEIAHGYFKNLLDLNPDYIFLPHIRGLKIENGYHPSKTCPLLQGEPYFLQSAFERQLHNGPKIISQYIDFDSSEENIKGYFISIAAKLGVERRQAIPAFEAAVKIQNEMQDHMVTLGKKLIREISENEDEVGIILFGRPYNAFVPEANKGIPHKFASRGIKTIPYDFLDLKNIPARAHMFWSMGQLILKGAEYVKTHPKLFGVYITSFSCGPDSFLIGYFRNIMGKKPSLTLELDSHTADAGIETRVEAFLDIVDRYRQLKRSAKLTDESKNKNYKPAAFNIQKNKPVVITSEGKELSLSNSNVRVVLPSMGRYGSQAISSAMKSQNIESIALPAVDEEILKIGRGNTMCKECLPLQLTFGSLLKYLRDIRPKGETTVYFMPTAEGPCRFGQYQDFMRDFVKKNEIENVAFMSLNSDDAYGGIGNKLSLLLWCAAIISDIFEDIHNSMLVVAENCDNALKELQNIWQSILSGLENGLKSLMSTVKQASSELRRIPKKLEIDQLPQVLVVGEIYVREEGLSRRWLPERLSKDGIISHIAPAHEWIYYTNWLVQHGLSDKARSITKKLLNRFRNSVLILIEKKIKNIMANSGWYIPRVVKIDEIIRVAENYLSRRLTGEAILTIGAPLLEVGREFCGAISIGPFACMPSRLSESILSLKMDRDHIMKIRGDKMSDYITREMDNLPLLVIESDGNPFPQLIESKLETFIIQAKRLHKIMMKYKG